MESVLLVDLGVVVQSAKDNLVMFCELFYLVESPQLIAFFQRIGDAGQQDEYLHRKEFREQR